jgi:[CysO sulfur-carrier protein]-S-L-cysteine hydrolase
VTTICGNALATIISHCQAEAPVEACGVVVSLPHDDTSDSQHVVGMVNALRSTTAYAFDPAEQLAVWESMDHLGQVPAMIYHSHTASPPVPSGKDVRWASESKAVYLIVQTAARDQDVVVCGWMINSGDELYAEERVELGCCANAAPVDPSACYLGNPE